MSTRYGTILTNGGAALIAASILNGTKLPITEAAVGDGGGSYYQPAADQTALKNEKWRGDIVSAEISATTANMIDVKIVIGEDVGGFVVREAAIYSDDGVMVAVCNTPDTEKVAISGGVPSKLTLLMHLVVADASALEFVINPSLDAVSREDLEATMAKHNADPKAHGGLKEEILTGLTKYVPVSEKGTDGGVAVLRGIRTRVRDPGKPDYGLGGGGETAEVSVVLLTGDHTGEAEVSALVNGQEYDIENMSTESGSAPNGTLILTNMEEF